MPESLRAMVAGHVTQDWYGTATLPGGGAFYAAQTLTGLGVPTALVTSVGAQFEHPEAFVGLNALVHRAARTTTFLNYYSEKGAREQWLTAQAAPLPPERVPHALRETDVLMLCPVFGELEVPAWTATVKARWVGLSVQGLVRSLGPESSDGSEARRVIPSRFPADSASLRGVQVAVLSEEDLADQDDLLGRLRQAVPIVVLTRAERGSTVFEQDRETPIGIVPTAVKDPTGAGDCYAAAFLFGLASGMPVDQAGKLGAAAASLIIEDRGGLALPMMGSARQRMDRVG